VSLSCKAKLQLSKGAADLFLICLLFLFPPTDGSRCHKHQKLITATQLLLFPVISALSLCGF